MIYGIKVYDKWLISDCNVLFNTTSYEVARIQADILRQSVRHVDEVIIVEIPRDDD